MENERFSGASGGPQLPNYWKTNSFCACRSLVKVGLKRASTAKVLENKQFAWVLRPGQGGPQEGLNHRTIGKQMVFVSVGIILRPVRPGTL